MSAATDYERRRDQRNLNPHRDARLAMLVYGREYSAQSLGSMDFYDQGHRCEFGDGHEGWHYASTGRDTGFTWGTPSGQLRAWLNIAEPPSFGLPEQAEAERLADAALDALRDPAPSDKASSESDGETRE